MTSLFQTASLDLLTQSAAASLVSHLWQSVLLAAAVAVCLRLAPRTTAALRFTIWSAAFLVLVLLPLLPAVSFSQPSAAGSLSASAGKAWFELDSRWGIALAALWAVASFWRAADLTLHILRLRRLWKSAQPVDPGTLPAEISVLAAGRRSATLCTTTSLDRPSVIGFLAPRVLIPGWLLNKLTPAELEQVILHETEHLRRGDDWTNLLQKLSLILFPLNPALLWIERRLCREREMACDEGVIQRTRAPRAYATCLTRLAESSQEHTAEALSLGSLGRRSELVVRVQSILRFRPLLGRTGTRRLLAGSLLGMALVSVEFRRCPQLVAFVPQPTPQIATKAEPHTLESTGRFQTVALPVTKETASYHAVPAVARVGSILAPASLKAQHQPQCRLQTRAVANRQSIAHYPAARAMNAIARASSSAPEPGRSMSFAEQALFQQNPGEPNTIAQNQPVKSWIVLTAWTTEEPASAEVLTTDEAAAQLPVPAASPTPDPARNRPRAQNQAQAQPAFTPLIFTVPGPGSSRPTFAAVPTRNGWLVIQL